MVAPLVFTVERSEPEFIVPAKPTPYEFKLLSDLDCQDGVREQFKIVLFYKSSVARQGDPARIIKAAIAEALVYYYPLAGRLMEMPNRKLKVECSGEGILFIEAHADVRLEQFGDMILPPFPCMEDLLYNVPNCDGILHCPLWLIQVTRFSCGGFLIASRINHTVCDGLGAMQFLNSVAEIARGVRGLSIQPVWGRELLVARDPPRVSYRHYAYERWNGTNSMTVESMAPLVDRSFFIRKKDISNLRKYLPFRLQKCSMFDILTAVVWRCRTIALDIHTNIEVRLAWYADARTKLNPPLPAGFYGNAIVLPGTVTTVDKLCWNPLWYTVELIGRAKAEMTEEFIRSSIDFLVKMGQPELEESHTFYVSDVTRVGGNLIDFGWGKPEYGGSEGAYIASSFYVSCPKNNIDEGIVVVMNLPGPAMEKFALEIENVIGLCSCIKNNISKCIPAPNEIWATVVKQTAIGCDKPRATEFKHPSPSE